LAPIWTQNTRMNRLAVLSVEARTDRDKGLDGPRWHRGSSYSEQTKISPPGRDPIGEERS
jgi:hypothetical protein